MRTVALAVLLVVVGFFGASEGATNSYVLTEPTLHFEWLNLTDIGQEFQLSAGCEDFSLGFDFPFFNQTYNSMKAHYDGVLTFDATCPSLGSTLSCWPTVAFSRAIAWFYGSLASCTDNFPGQCSYHYASQQNCSYSLLSDHACFVLEFRDVSWAIAGFVYTKAVTVQTILVDNGVIIFQYKDKGEVTTWKGAFAGIQDASASFTEFALIPEDCPAAQPRYQEGGRPFFEDGTAMAFIPDGENIPCPSNRPLPLPSNKECTCIDEDEDGYHCDDLCPEDPNKSEPGFCGCGEPETDSDGDGTPDCVDLCPEDPLKSTPGFCGCNVEDIAEPGQGIKCPPGTFNNGDGSTAASLSSPLQTISSIFM
ncbi:Thrombospondin [Balamuthia mandrillaris]